MPTGPREARPDDRLRIEPGISRFRVWSFGPSRNDDGEIGKNEFKQMTGAETLDVARDAIWTIVVVSSPLLVVGLVVGVAVSLFQALTQIQEQTLVFVPKILAIFVTLLLALPFMADSLHSHMMRISSRIIGG
jgi:flagellar biosynthetic protein FliQ